MTGLRVFLAAVWLAVGLAGCAPGAVNETGESDQAYCYGVWVSYTDSAKMAATGDFSAALERFCTQARDMGLNTVFWHACAFADAIWPSQVYPMAAWCEGVDRLAEIVKVCHAHDLQVHVWLNPYRVSRDREAVPDERLTARLGEEDFCRCAQGSYLNPASPAARGVVLQAIREIAQGYAVDGVHFDDYFYPTTDDSFDEVSYAAYCAQAPRPLARDVWRRTNVNVLIASTAQLAREYRLAFTVSPCADMDKNYRTLYADVIGWCRAGYLDAVIPQIYFGFEYPDEAYAFDRLTVEWIKATAGGPAALYIGMAPYKLGSTVPADAPEWGEGVDLLARETAYLAAQPAVRGAVYFSASSLFAEDEAHTTQRELLAKQIT